MKNKALLIVSFTLMFVGCRPTKELVTEDKVDLVQYAGTWYEIARFPNRFERNLKCVTADYSLTENGAIKVINKGYNVNKEKWSEANGTAKVPNSKKPGEIKVSFFKPFYGDYFIIKLDKDYKHVLVGSPSREYLWILSRAKKMNQNEYEKYVGIAKEKGFNVSILEKTVQDCTN
jgi:apolipoprotein D and lipocalin family protein